MDRLSIERALAELERQLAEGALTKGAAATTRRDLLQELAALERASTAPAEVAASLDMFMTGGPGMAPSAPAPSPTPSTAPSTPPIRRPDPHEGPIGADFFATGGGAPPPAAPEPAASTPQAEEAVYPVDSGTLVGYVAAGRYAILQELGRGGMGRVYKALDQQTRQMLALKTLESHLMGTDWSEKWLQELQIHTRLKHAHIVPMRKLEKDERLGFFLTMDFVEGEDLQQFVQARHRIPGAPFPLPVSFALLRQIADALDHAHQQGVLHLDIKPHNVMLEGVSVPSATYHSAAISMFSFGAAKLIDFGIARLRTGGQDGAVMGTVYYMAPEQLNGSGMLSAATDIYALGVVTYQLLTGQLFQGGMPGPSHLNGDVSEAVDDVFAKAVTFRPEERFQRAGAFLDALEQAQKQGARATLSEPPVQRGDVQVRRLKERGTKKVVQRPKEDGPSISEKKWPQIKEGIDAKRPLWLELPFVRKAPIVESADTCPPEVRAKIRVTPLEGSLLLLSKTNKPLLELCPVESGSFSMGASSKNRAAKRAEKPEVKVDMTGFWMARTPVTHGMWHTFLDESKYRIDPSVRHPEYLAEWELGRPPDALLMHPITCISVLDAWAFCDFYGVALPSEAQWEYAARGADGRLYPWGDDIPDANQPASMKAHIAQKRSFTVPVGMRLEGASPFGMLDMIGPVKEWVADEFDARFFRSIRHPNPVLRGERRGGFASIRGASSMTAPEQAQAFRRHQASPDACDPAVGFRVCLDFLP